MLMRYTVTRRDVLLLLIGAATVHLLPSSLQHARQQIVVETVCESGNHEKVVYRTATTTVTRATTTTVVSQPTLAPEVGIVNLDLVTQLPQTRVTGHAPGWTLFNDVYVSNGTFYIVSDRPVTDFPRIPHMISTPLEAFNTPENIQARMPTKDTLDVITSAEALRRWGGDVRRGQKNRVYTAAGNTVFVNEPNQFLNHYYHLVAELFMGVQAMLLGAVTTPASGRKVDKMRDFTLLPVHDKFNPAPAPIDRVIFARTTSEGWRDIPDFNSYFMRAAFPGASIEEESDWEDRTIITARGDRAWHFPQLLLTDRSAAHRGDVCGSRTQRIAAEAFEAMRKQGRLVGLRAAGWWAPVREAVLRFAGVEEQDDIVAIGQRAAKADMLPMPPAGKIVITYLSRQSTPRRRLIPSCHTDLVTALRTLVARKGPTWELNIVEAEKLSKDDQIKHAARTTIMLGVHGNGLTHLVMMRPNRLSTVIEMFYPGGFTHDYQWPTHALGMRHFAVWNDTWRTDGVGEGKPMVAYPEGFQGDAIPVNGETVAKLIEARVEGRIAGI